MGSKRCRKRSIRRGQVRDFLPGPETSWTRNLPSAPRQASLEIKQNLFFKLLHWGYCSTTSTLYTFVFTLTWSVLSLVFQGPNKQAVSLYNTCFPEGSLSSHLNRFLSFRQLRIVEWGKKEKFWSSQLIHQTWYGANRTAFDIFPPPAKIRPHSAVNFSCST